MNRAFLSFLTFPARIMLRAIFRVFFSLSQFRGVLIIDVTYDRKEHDNVHQLKMIHSRN